MRRAPSLVAAVLLVPLLTGCVLPGEGATTQSAGPSLEDVGAIYARVEALLTDLPCELDAPVGRETTANLRPLVEMDLHEGQELELDIRGDLMLVARYTGGGFDVVNIRDPLDPQHVGSLAFEKSSAADVKWMPDGTSAVVSTSFPRGNITLVDLSDPANPVPMANLSLKEHFAAQGSGPKVGSGNVQAHMMWPHLIDGREWIFVPTQTAAKPLVVLERVGWELAVKAEYAFPHLALPPAVPLHSDPALGNHDVTVYDDPLLEKPILFVSEGFLGWRALDVSDPEAPVELGGTLSPEPGIGYTHSVRVWYVDGKRIVITMSEAGMNTLKIYDATDLRSPKLLGRWNADATRPHIPQHNIQILPDGTLLMAHYTEGLLIFDLKPVLTASNPVQGSMAIRPMARLAPWAPSAPDELGFADVTEVLVKDGILWVVDHEEGFASVAFGCLARGEGGVTVTT